jgi:multisubunit Na+/H+ antiporter MnhF subunit
VTVWSVSALLLMVGALGPAAYLGLRGGALDRLVGLQLAGALLAGLFLLLAHGFTQSSYMLVALVLAVLSFPGILVFLRLLETRR